MNLRDNTLRILRFDHPESVTGAPIHGLRYHGCDHQGYEGGGHHLPVGSVWTDIWGTIWHKEHPDVMGFPRGNPLADPKALKAYRWPDPDDPRICGTLDEQAKQYRPGDSFLGGAHRDTLWEKAYMLVGMENMMVCFYEEPAFAREVLHRIMDFQLGIARHYLKLGVEWIQAGDDLGTQIAPLISPPLVRQFLVPEYRRLFDLYRERGVIIEFHSCGHIEPFLEMFMELGINCLNPVQATANNLDRVRAATQGRLALSGGVSTDTIMKGPLERIVAEVRQRLWQLGRDGGYFCNPDQGMPFPPGHYEAFRAAVEQYGRYPLQPPPAA